MRGERGRGQILHVPMCLLCLFVSLYACMCVSVPVCVCVCLCVYAHVQALPCPSVPTVCPYVCGAGHTLSPCPAADKKAAPMNLLYPLTAQRWAAVMGHCLFSRGWQLWAITQPEGGDTPQTEPDSRATVGRQWVPGGARAPEVIGETSSTSRAPGQGLPSLRTDSSTHRQTLMLFLLQVTVLWGVQTCQTGPLPLASPEIQIGSRQLQFAPASLPDPWVWHEHNQVVPRHPIHTWVSKLCLWLSILGSVFGCCRRRSAGHSLVNRGNRLVSTR